MENETVIRRQQFKNIPKTRKKEKFYVEIKDYIKKKKNYQEFKNNAVSVLLPKLTSAVHTNMEFKLHVVRLAMSSSSLVNGRLCAIRRC